MLRLFDAVLSFFAMIRQFDAFFCREILNRRRRKGQESQLVFVLLGDAEVTSDQLKSDVN